MQKLFKAVWMYRHFIASSIRNDLRMRFARSKLGGLWMILQPLAQVAIYAVVLSRVMGSRLPGTTNEYAYVIYLIAGMVAWSLFAETVSRCLTIFVDNGNLLKKIVFPRISLPLIVAGSALTSNLLLLLAAVGVFLLVGHAPTWQMAWLLILIPVNMAFSVGLGLILGILNVFVRDVGQVMVVVLQLWFWMTPIVYMPSILPGPFRTVIECNPMYYIASGFQDVMLYGTAPPLENVGYVAVAAVVMLALALAMFRRANAEMVDVL
ncbi:ABC transporter permease [Luteibacter yeojuensis]|uniref:Transport permease protein n=1 Tax=Luteibacter yeojuensis TaxID=345309 RepID=A0A0F3KL14_9GAMM|nr:ABC transporter permease [Luteibacter yeojuensis]KJV31652.1 ABC transporter [Luteibacter yeojuensis]